MNFQYLLVVYDHFTNAESARNCGDAFYHPEGYVSSLAPLSQHGVSNFNHNLLAFSKYWSTPEQHVSACILTDNEQIAVSAMFTQNTTDLIFQQAIFFNSI